MAAGCMALRVEIEVLDPVLNPLEHRKSVGEHAPVNESAGRHAWHTVQIRQI